MRPSGKRYLHQLFIQERKEPANLRQAYYSYEESLLPAQSFFAHTSAERRVYEPSSSQKRKSGREMKNETIRILSWKTKKSKFLTDFRAEIQKHEFQADSDWRRI